MKRALFFACALSPLGCSVLFPIDDATYRRATDDGGEAGAASGGSSTGGTGGGDAGASSDGGSTGGGTTVLPAPVHRYPFDDGSGDFPRDAGSDKMNGTIISGVTFASDSTHPGFALFADNAAIEFSPDFFKELPRTITLWIKPDKPELRTILDQQSATTDAGFRFLLGQTGGSNVPELRIGGKVGAAAVPAKSQLAVGSWAHLAFSYEPLGSNQAKVAIYLNGKLEVEQSSSFVHPIQNNATPFRVGLPAHNNDMASFMGGIDELRVYNKVLTEEQIATIYLGND